MEHQKPPLPQLTFETVTQKVDLTNLRTHVRGTGCQISFCVGMKNNL